MKGLLVMKHNTVISLKKPLRQIFFKSNNLINTRYMSNVRGPQSLLINILQLFTNLKRNVTSGLCITENLLSQGCSFLFFFAL